MKYNPNLKYHGSPYDFDYIDLSKSKGFKDFGRGFYMSNERWHAEGAAKNNKKFIGTSYIYYCDLARKFPEYINKKVFREPTVEWLDFILLNRNNKYTIHDYDIVYGPTADATMAVVLDDYRLGLYGIVDDYETKKKVVQELKPYKYPRQICLCTQKSLQFIQIVKKYKL